MYICCIVEELIYGCELVENLCYDLLLGEIYGESFVEWLLYYFIIICEELLLMGWIIDNMILGKVFVDLSLLLMDVVMDCVMICGSLVFNMDVKVVLEGFGLEEGVNSDFKQFVVEKVFVGDGV